MTNNHNLKEEKPLIIKRLNRLKFIHITMMASPPINTFESLDDKKSEDVNVPRCHECGHKVFWDAFRLADNHIYCKDCVIALANKVVSK